jgi:hypothetical protein
VRFWCGLGAKMKPKYMGNVEKGATKKIDANFIGLLHENQLVFQICYIYRKKQEFLKSSPVLGRCST